MVSSRYPEFLYHGTSTGYIENILKIGLCPPYELEESVICWTAILDVAEWHANHMAESDRGSLCKPCKQIIFKIPFDRFDIEGFRLETNYIRLGPSGHPSMNYVPKKDPDGRNWTWQSLLEYAGAVGYKLPLPVTESDFYYMSRYKISKTYKRYREIDRV